MKALPAVLILGAVALFHLFVLLPLKQRQGELHAELVRQSHNRGLDASRAAERLEAFYRRMARPEQTTDWLASLHAIGVASGVALESARYQTQPAPGRVERYELVLPVSGSYARVREFLLRALAEIPLLSLDELALRRAAPDDSRVQAELRMTLHRVAP